jgi:SulP family sulfate permease
MLAREEDVEAQGLRVQGWSVSAIARHLGRDPRTIKGYLALALCKNPPQPSLGGFMGTSPPSNPGRPGESPADRKGPGRFMAAARSGVVIGVVVVVCATSFAVLIFPGNLSANIPAGIGLALFTAMVTMAAVAVLSTLPGTVGSTQDTTAVILALIAASIAGRMAPGDPRTFFTVVLALGLASGLTGAVFLLLGLFRLGDFIRFVPHPVIGGFLAGTGWLLFKGGMGVLAGRELALSGLSDFARVAVVQKWLPGLTFAIVLVFLSR